MARAVTIREHAAANTRARNTRARSLWPSRQGFLASFAGLVSLVRFESFMSFVILAAFVTMRSASASAQTADVQKLLAEIKRADTDKLAVSEEDGRFLRVMIATSGATRVLEIGGAYGYSAIWMGLGLRQTGGRLTTIEYDPARARAAAENVRKAGLADIVTVISGDAFKEIPKLEGPFDFVFLDAWKRDYKGFLDLMLPRLGPRGLFLAHNVVNKRLEMRDFLDAIRNDPRLFTATVAPSSEGISVSVKIR
jgi:caffeoyl-CoA O-methyltransferase